MNYILHCNIAVKLYTLSFITNYCIYTYCIYMYSYIIDKTNKSLTNVLANLIKYDT